MEKELVNNSKGEIMGNVVKPTQERLLYGWEQDKFRTILHLGKMRKAVVIHHSYIGVYFKIGVASFFPFPDEIIDNKYPTLEEAKNVATSYISGWLNDTNLALNLV